MLDDMTGTRTRWLAWLCRVGFHDWVWAGNMKMCSRCTTPLEDHEDI